MDASRLPSFQCVEGDIHKSFSPKSQAGVVVLGDAIKAVKPYFGQGANSALEDVAVLSRCLEQAADEPLNFWLLEPKSIKSAPTITAPKSTGAHWSGRH